MDLTTIPYLLLLAAVGLARLAELRISRRHQQEMSRAGIEKQADPGFRWMVALHTIILAGAGLEVVAVHRPLVPGLAIAMAALFTLATALRWWVIRVMGRHWNVEVMASSPMGVVSEGPFRWVRHPNYLAVFVEMAALPLMHGAWITATAAIVGNALILRHRLGIEEPVLESNPSYRAAMDGKARFLPGLF